MKFNDLYNRVFVNEENNEVAVPSDFDIEKAPLPPSTVADPATGEVPALKTTSEHGSLNNYKEQINNFIKTLIEPGNDSLLAFANKISGENTPFTGLSDRLRSNVAQAAKSLGDIVVDIDIVLNKISSNPNANPTVG
jgi:hypothetical protein